MTTPAAKKPHVCHACIGDPYLKAEVLEQGTPNRCMSCKRRRKAIWIGDLADRINATVLEQFEVSPSDEGQSYAEVVEEQAKLPTDVAEEVQGWLSAVRGYTAIKDGEDDIWKNASFVEGGAIHDTYHQLWREFRQSITNDARYYNRRAEQILDDIFEEVSQAADWRGKRAVVTLPAHPRTPAFVRGRVAQSQDELDTILRDPSRQLGAPPPGRASAGRMNAAGVSVFYCAADQATCRVECRPPVESHIVFGSFELLRPVRVLDLAALTFLAIEESIFAPDYDKKLARAMFLRRLNGEISQPVMPGEETFGYLHTQAVADYLAQKLDLDGVFYRSTQSGRATIGRGMYRQNLVLFAHAARVEPIDFPNTEISIDFGWEENGDGDDSITISEDARRKKRKTRAKPKGGLLFIEPKPIATDTRPMTLRLRLDSLKVERIRGLDYDVDERDVRRHRFTLADQKRARDLF